MPNRCAKVMSRTYHGVEAPAVRVEVHITPGTPGFTMSGLPDAMVKESRHRIRSAIINSGYAFPWEKVAINLGPAEVTKQGSHLDLAIAVAVLQADGQLPSVDAELEFIGELGLDGEIHGSDMLFNMAHAVRREDNVLVSVDPKDETLALLTGLRCLWFSHLSQVCLHLVGARVRPLARISGPKEPRGSPDKVHPFTLCPGQEQAARMLILMAAGGHHGLMVGPPGSGKTHLAQLLQQLSPGLSEETACEVALCYGAAGMPRAGPWWRPPIRQPHHSASDMAVVGGGRPIRAGEITLAHWGILFLDELPEFNGRTLDMLRQPLEQGTIMLSRVAERCMLPCRFQLLTAMNPCVCGYFGHPQRRCTCAPGRVARYIGRVSGPLLDRIDCQCWVGFKEGGQEPAGSSLPLKAWRKQVQRVQQLQHERQGGLNASADAEVIRAWHWKEGAQDALREWRRRHAWDQRSVIKLQRLARTVADLAESELITLDHLHEAARYRDVLARLKDRL